MRLANFIDERGNAVLEFLGLAILVIAPIATFSTTLSLEWVEKSQLQCAADLMARAYSIAGIDGFEQQKERSERDGWVTTVEHSGALVTVTVQSGGLVARARGID